ncbi:phage minor head protein [Bartonella sp. LJL80]
MQKIDLKRQIKAKGSHRAQIDAPLINTTKAQKNDLARLYVNIVRIWQQGSKEQIIPEYQRSLEQASSNDGMIADRASDLEVIIEAIESAAVQATFTFRNLFRSWSQSFQLWHMRRFIRSILYATNVDLSTQISGDDVTETMEDILARNVALVRDVSNQTRGRIADIVFRGLQNRTPVRDVAKQISAATGMARDRSLRIASDQTVKLSSELDKQRQLQMGMTDFEWIHSGKKHYRPEHLARNGKIFSWTSEVAKTDPPGHAPFCGCKAKGKLRLV